MHEPFSLLVPVYDGDRPDYLRRAFRSAVHDHEPIDVAVYIPGRMKLSGLRTAM